MGKVISIINMKGGVGKTTLSIGIADYLAEIGKKVLLIEDVYKRQDESKTCSIRSNSRLSRGWC